MPTSFRLAVYLLITQLVGVALALALWANGALALGLALLAALGLAWPLLRTLQQVEDALRQLAEGHPPTALGERWRGPLGGLVRGLNVWLVRAQETAALRADLLNQTRDSAAQQERNRLARELHDSIKQQLFTIHISAAATQAHLGSDPARAAAALADVRRAAQEALAEMNALLQQLAPAPLEKVGLRQALRDQCEALAYRTGATVTTDLREIPDEALTPTMAEALFRMAQEALSNITRHARAQNVTVSLQLQNDLLTLTIADDGQGFDVNQTSPGMGLANLRQRATALGGRLATHTTPGRGTTLLVHIPRFKPVILPIMFTPNHAFNKAVAAGFAGGLGLLLVLYYPLYVLWPRQFVADWPAPVAFDGWGLLLQVVAALLVVGVGYSAARWAPAKTRAWAATFGALAGLSACVLAYFGIGNAAMSLPAQASLLAHPLFPIPDPEFIRLLASAMTGVLGWIPAAFWGMIGIGAGLGALGGILGSSSARATTTPLNTLARPTTQRLPATLVAINGLSSVAFGSGLSLFLILFLFGGLEASLEQAFTEAQWPAPNLAPYFVGFFVSAIALYALCLGGAYALLRAASALPLTDDLSRARRLQAPQNAALTAAVLGVWIGALLWAMTGMSLGGGTRAAIWLACGTSLLFSGLFAHLAWEARRRLKAENHPIQAWDWVPDMVGGLTLAGLAPALGAISQALSYPTPEHLAWAIALGVLEGTWLIYLVRHHRRAAPTLLQTLNLPIATSGLLTAMGSMLFSFGLLLAPIQALVGIAIPAIAPLVDTAPLGLTWAKLVADHYLLSAQLLFLAILIIVGSSGLVLLVMWVLGKRPLSVTSES